MLNYNKSKLPPGISKWITERKLKIEIILTVITCTGILIHAFDKETGEAILNIAMSIQAVFYFILAYTPLEIDGWFPQMLQKVISIACSVCMIGLLFSILGLTGSDEMLMIGFSTLSVAGFLLLLIAMKSWNEKLWPLFVRIVVLTVITALIRFDVISF